MPDYIFAKNARSTHPSSLHKLPLV